MIDVLGDQSIAGFEFGYFSYDATAFQFIDDVISFGVGVNPWREFIWKVSRVSENPVSLVPAPTQSTRSSSGGRSLFSQKLAVPALSWAQVRLCAQKRIWCRLRGLSSIAF